MESYRVSSTLNERDREYLIQTVNEAHLGSVRTTVFVNGVRTESIVCPHPPSNDPEKILSLVKLTHGEKKKELELLLSAYRKVFQSGDTILMFQLGTAFFYKGFFSEARELFASSARLQKNHHQAYCYLGQAALELGRLDEAMEAALASVSLQPGYPDYRNALGEVHLAKNDWLSAITEFETAVSINLYYAQAYFSLGLAVILQAANRPNRSELPGLIHRITECFGKATLIEPTYRGQALDLGLTSINKHDFNAALATLKGILDEKKERQRREFATLHMKFVLHPEWVSDQVILKRIEFLETEIKKNPNYADLMSELALCYLEQSRLVCQKGVKQYQKTLEVNSSLEKVHEALKHADTALESMNDSLAAIGAKRNG